VTHTAPSAERRVLAGGMVAASLVPLNSTMIAVGLPDVADDLDVSRGTAAALVIAYLAAMALCQPLAGRAGDRYGSRRVALAALVGFGVMSAVAASAPSFSLLVATRVAQAVFGAALIPNVQTLVRSAVAPERRGRAFGILGLGIGAGAAIGPVVGGVLIDVAGWRSIFLVNTPVAAVAVVLVARVVDGHVRAEKVELDGALLHGKFLAACASQATSSLTQYSILLAVPMLLDERGWSSSEVGAVLLGMTAGLLLLSPMGGSLGDRRGRLLPIVAGMGMLTAGAVLVAAVGGEVPPVLIAGVILVGVGLGIASASLQAAAVDAVPAHRTAAGAGVFSTSRYVGSITGSVALAAVGPRPVLVLTVVAGAAAVATGARVEAGHSRTAASGR
jgi:DHA2 family methylenomycin A resistance protein-like MFS transporter